MVVDPRRPGQVLALGELLRIDGYRGGARVSDWPTCGM